MKKKLSIILSLFLAALLVSCDPANKPARGVEDEIYVFADSVEYEELRLALETVFQKEIFTPQPEQIFTLKPKPIHELEKFRNRKNIIIAAPLNSGSVTSEFIDVILDSASKANILADSAYFIQKYNLWAKNQLVTFMTGPSIQQLEFEILRNGDNLLYAYQKISDKRLYESLYNPTYEKKDIEGKLLKDYGWIIYVQADYHLAMNKPNDNFVWLRRSPGSDMERWIFVHWIDSASPAYLNVDSIRAIRNKITEKFYKTTWDEAYVHIAQDYFTTNEINFKGRYAIFTQGLWELNIKGMGGPFVNYTFFDEKTNRIYMLDGSVYAPKYYKRNLIQQMDVTLQSFFTADELSESRRKELLKAAE